MQYRSVKGFTGAAQLGILLVFLGAGLVLAAGSQYLVALKMMPKGMPIDRMMAESIKALLLPENVFYARLSQTLGSFFILFFPALMYMLVCHGKNLFWLGFSTQLNYKQVLIGFLLIFFAGLVASPLAELSKYIVAHYPALNVKALALERDYDEQIVAMGSLKTWGEFFMALVVMAFLPAVFEEVFFRGTVQQILNRWWQSPLAAIIVTSLLFSFIHLSIYLFLSRAVLGFVLGLMYEKSKNIWVNIMAHFLNNVLALLQLLYLSTRKAGELQDFSQKNMVLWAGIFAAVATFGLFYIFEKVSVKNRTQVEFKEQNLVEQHYYNKPA